MKDDRCSSGSRLISNFQEMFQLAESRQAGNPGEEKLKQFIEQRLKTSGYKVSRQGFRFPQIPRLYNEQFINAIFVIAAILLIHTAPLIGFMLPVIFSILPALMLESERLFPKKNYAENIIAVPEHFRIENSSMLVVAHMDTANTIPFPGERAGKFIGFCQRSYFNISFIIAIQCLGVIMNIPIPLPITFAINALIFIIVITTISYQIWASCFRNSTYSPGANDNTSGVAAALTLAETYGNGLNNQTIRPAFLFTSAEEQGLFGAIAFTNSGVDWAGKPSVINLDSLAGGNKLGLVTRYGRMLPAYTSRAINRTAREIDHNLVDIIHIHRCGDYLPFIRAGYQVISLETDWNGGTPPEYHTVEDIPDRMNFELFSKAYSVLVKTINHLSNTMQEE